MLTPLQDLSFDEWLEKYKGQLLVGFVCFDRSNVRITKIQPLTKDNKVVKDSDCAPSVRQFCIEIPLGEVLFPR